jgi:hypothetical protein
VRAFIFESHLRKIGPVTERYALLQENSRAGRDQSNFGMNVILLSALIGGFFLRKKPLECEVSVYSNSEIAVGFSATYVACAREQLSS